MKCKLRVTYHRYNLLIDGIITKRSCVKSGEGKILVEIGKSSILCDPEDVFVNVDLNLSQISQDVINELPFKETPSDNTKS